MNPNAPGGEARGGRFVEADLFRRWRKNWSSTVEKHYSDPIIRFPDYFRLMVHAISVNSQNELIWNADNTGDN
jgi:hypothetical protein